MFLWLTKNVLCEKYLASLPLMHESELTSKSGASCQFGEVLNLDFWSNFRHIKHLDLFGQAFQSVAK